jgi:hypothetical protein
MTKLSKTLAQASIVEEVFDIDASTANLNLFADLLHIAVRFSPWTQPANYEISLEEAAILLPLADMYDCPAMFNILQERVAFLAITNPWEVLVLACDQNDVTMGQTAIFYLSDQLVHEGAGVGYSMTLWENISKLSSAWQLEFLRLYMTSTRRINSGSLVVGHFDGSFSVWLNTSIPRNMNAMTGEVDGTKSRVLSLRRSMFVSVGIWSFGACAFFTDLISTQMTARFVCNAVNQDGRFARVASIRTIHINTSHPLPRSHQRVRSPHHRLPDRAIAPDQVG